MSEFNVCPNRSLLVVHGLRHRHHIPSTSPPENFAETISQEKGFFFAIIIDGVGMPEDEKVPYADRWPKWMTDLREQNEPPVSYGCIIL
jgi:hypothetical protein